MITCSVCGQQNDDLVVLCISCRSYLQTKVDNINLFETVWQLIEAPRAAFKKIILAHHKNYVVVLGSLLGVSIAFAMFWAMSIGNRFENLLMLVGAGGMLGIPLGALLAFLLGLVVAGGIRFLGGRSASPREARAVVCYAGMPLVLSLVVILPIEIAIFGIDFFGTNPPPMVINPVVYLALLGLDALAGLWSMLLLYKGVTVMSGFRKVKSLLVTLATVLIPIAVSFGMRLLGVV